MSTRPHAPRPRGRWEEMWKDADGWLYPRDHFGPFDPDECDREEFGYEPVLVRVLKDRKRAREMEKDSGGQEGVTP